MSAAPGVVYTRPWVAALMLDIVGYTSDKSLQDLTLVEPSCGNGVFLAEAVERLCKSIEGTIDPSLIRDSLFACEISPDAANTARKSVAGILAAHGVSAQDAEQLAEHWIKTADFYETSLPQADFVVGNPPYVRSSEIERNVREGYSRRFKTMTMGTDLYVGFFEKGTSCLKQRGKLCFICADRWLQNRYGKALRRYIRESYSLEALVRMHDVNVFEKSVSSYPAITLIGTAPRQTTRYTICDNSITNADLGPLAKWAAGGESTGMRFPNCTITAPKDDGPYALGDAESIALVASANMNLPRLEETGVKVGIGLATGCDDVLMVDDNPGIEESRLLPLFHMRDHREGKRQKRMLVNVWNDDGSLVDLDDYPLLASYLEKNREKLERRAVAKKNPKAWFRTLDKLNPDLLGKTLILFPDMATDPRPCLSDGSRYPQHGCYWVEPGEWDPEVLGGLLISDQARLFVEAYGVRMRGGTLRFQAQYLRTIRVPRREQISPSDAVRLKHAFEQNDVHAASIVADRLYREVS